MPDTVIQDSAANLLLEKIRQYAGEKYCQWIVDENVDIHCVDRVVKINQQIAITTNRFDVWQAAKNHGVDAYLNDFDCTTKPEIESPLIYYRLSKEKPLVKYLIEKSLGNIKNGGRLFITGKKNEGIKTIAKQLSQRLDCKLTADKHRDAYLIEINSDDVHLFQEDFAVISAYESWQRIKTPAFSYWSKPGIFGWEKIDNGSALLMDTVETALTDQTFSSCLDLGCGWGYLTFRSLSLTIEERYATDNNVIAIEAIRKNCSEWSLAINASCDNCAENINKKFDLILCNPPFHQGFSSDMGLITQFLARSSQLLKANGQAYFVVNQFVPLPREAKKLKLRCEELSAQQGFIVFRISHDS